MKYPRPDRNTKKVLAYRERDLELLKQTGKKYILGLDEVGTGSAIGHFLVGSYLHCDVDLYDRLPNIGDSKNLTQKSRQNIVESIDLTRYNEYVATLDEINRHKNMRVTLHNATEKLIEQSVEASGLPISDILVVVDGDAKYKKKGLSIVSIPKADRTYTAVSVAAIVAKTNRDNAMVELDNQDKYAVYKPGKNNGYMTKDHIRALKQYGKSDLHRYFVNY